MKPTKKCYDFIKKEEGCVLNAYMDSVGIWTIGIGSILYKDGTRVKRGDKITYSEAMELFEWEVDRKAKVVEGLISHTSLNQNQYEALVSYTYNCGVGALESSTLRKKIRLNPCDPTIRDEFNKWCKGRINGKLVALKGLQNRRKREADYYFSKTI